MGKLDKMKASSNKTLREASSSEVVPLKVELPEVFKRATDRLSGVVKKIRNDFGIKNEKFIGSTAYINRKRYTLLSLKQILGEASEGEYDELAQKLESRMDEIEKEYESFGEGTTRLEEFDAIMAKVEIARKAGDLSKAVDLQKEYLARWKGRMPVHERMSVMYWMAKDMERRAKDYEEIMEFEKVQMFGKDVRVGDEIFIMADHWGKKVIGEFWKVEHVYLNEGMMVSCEQTGEKGKHLALDEIEKFFTDRLKAHRAKDPTFELAVLPRLVKPKTGSEKWLGEIAAAMKEMAVLDLEQEVLQMNKEASFLPIDGYDTPKLPKGVLVIFGQLMFLPEFAFEHANFRGPVLQKLKEHLARQKMLDQIQETSGNMKALLEVEFSFKEGKLEEGREGAIKLFNKLRKVKEEKLSVEDVMIFAKVRGYLKGMWVKYATQLVNMNYQIFGDQAIERVRHEMHYKPGQMRIFSAAFRQVRSRNEGVLTNVLEGLGDEDLVKDPTRYLRNKLAEDSKVSKGNRSAVRLCEKIWVEVLRSESLFIGDGVDAKKQYAKTAKLLRELGNFDVAEDYMVRGLRDKIALLKDSNYLKSKKMEIEMRLQKDKEMYKREAKARFLLEQRGKKFKPLPEHVLDKMVQDSISKAADDQVKKMVLTQIVKMKNAGNLKGVEKTLAESYDQMRDPMDSLFILSDEEVEAMGDLIIEATASAILVALSGGTSFVAGAGMRAMVSQMGARRFFGWGAEFFTKVIAFEATHKALEPVLIGGPGFTTVEDFGKSVGSGIVMFGALDAGNAMVGTLRTLRAARLAAKAQKMSKVEVASFWTSQIAAEAGVMTNVAWMEQMAHGVDIADMDTMSMYLRNLKMILELRAGGKFVKPVTHALHEKGKEYKQEIAEVEGIANRFSEFGLEKVFRENLRRAPISEAVEKTMEFGNLERGDMVEHKGERYVVVSKDPSNGKVELGDPRQMPVSAKGNLRVGANTLSFIRNERGRRFGPDRFGDVEGGASQRNGFVKKAIEIAGEVRDRFRLGVDMHRTAMEGWDVKYSGLPFEEIAAGLKSVFGLGRETGEVKEFKEVGGMFETLKKTAGRYMGNILHNGVRDHADGQHTDGLGEYHNEIYALMKDGEMRARVARNTEDPQYLENAAKEVSKLVKEGRTLDDAVNWFLRGELASAEWGNHSDHQALHFSTNAILDGYYGSETGNEAFIIYPEKNVVQGRDYWSRAESTGASRDTFYNDVWVWPKGPKSSTLALDGAFVFLPRDNSVDVATGSLYEVRDGKAVLDVSKIESFSIHREEYFDALRNRRDNLEAFEAVLEKIGMSEIELSHMRGNSGVWGTTVSDRLVVEAMCEGRQLKEMQRYLMTVLKANMFNELGYALKYFVNFEDLRPGGHEEMAKILEAHGFDIELLKEMLKNDELRLKWSAFMQRHGGSYRTAGLSSNGVFYKKALTTVRSREYHDKKIRDLFLEVHVTEYVGENQDVVEYRGIGKDGKPKVLKIVFYTDADPNRAVRKLYKDLGIRFDDTVIDDVDVPGHEAGKARQVGPRDVKYDHDINRLRQAIVDRVEGRPAEAKVETPRAKNARLLDQLTEFEAGMDRELTDVEDKVERADRDKVFDQDRDIQRVYSGEISHAEYGKMVYEQATRAGELLSKMEAEIADNPHVTLKEIYERFILEQPVSKEIAHKLLKTAEYLLRMQKRSMVYEKMVVNHGAGRFRSGELSRVEAAAGKDAIVKMLNIPGFDSIDGNIIIRTKGDDFNRGGGGTLVLEVSSPETFRKIMEAAHVDEVCNTRGAVIDIPGLGIPVLVLNETAVRAASKHETHPFSEVDKIVDHEVQHVKKRATNPMERGEQSADMYFAEFVHGSRPFVVDGVENGAEVKRYMDAFLDRIKVKFKDEFLAFMIHGASQRQMNVAVLDRKAYDYVGQNIDVLNANFQWQLGRDMSEGEIKYLRNQYKEFCDGLLTLVFRLEGEFMEKGMKKKNVRQKLRDYLHLVPVEDWRFHLMHLARNELGWSGIDIRMDRHEYMLDKKLDLPHNVTQAKVAAVKPVRARKRGKKPVKVEGLKRTPMVDDNGRKVDAAEGLPAIDTPRQLEDVIVRNAEVGMHGYLRDTSKPTGWNGWGRFRSKLPVWVVSDKQGYARGMLRKADIGILDVLGISREVGEEFLPSQMSGVGQFYIGFMKPSEVNVFSGGEEIPNKGFINRMLRGDVEGYTPKVLEGTRVVKHSDLVAGGVDEPVYHVAFGFPIRGDGRGASAPNVYFMSLPESVALKLYERISKDPSFFENFVKRLTIENLGISEEDWSGTEGKGDGVGYRPPLKGTNPDIYIVPPHEVGSTKLRKNFDPAFIRKFYPEGGEVVKVTEGVGAAAKGAVEGAGVPAAAPKPTRNLEALKKAYDKVGEDADSNGYRYVELNGKGGLVDKDGVEVVEPNKYEVLYRLDSGKFISDDGFIMVGAKEGGQGLIKIDGTEFIAPGRYEKVHAFLTWGREFRFISDDGFVIVESGKKQGLVDKDGVEAVTPGRFDGIFSAADGRRFLFDVGLVNVQEGKKKKAMLFPEIAASGYKVEGVEVDPEAQNLGDGYRSYRRDGKWGVLDSRGLWGVAPKYLKVGDYRNQFFSVQNEDGKWGFVAPPTMEVVPFEYDSVKYSSEIEGVQYECSVGEEVHYYDRNLNRVDSEGVPQAVPESVNWRARYAAAPPGETGMGSVLGRTGGYGLFDISGRRELVAPDYSQGPERPNAKGFLEVYAIGGGKAGLYNTVVHKEVVPVKYDEVQTPWDPERNYPMVKLGGREGVYDIAAKREIFEAKYDSAYVNDRGVAKLVLGDTVEYYKVEKGKDPVKCDKNGKPLEVAKSEVALDPTPRTLEEAKAHYDEVREHLRTPQGYLIVRKDGKVGVYDEKKGLEIVPLKYDRLYRDQPNGGPDIYVIGIEDGGKSTMGKCGFFDMKNLREIVPPKYDRYTIADREGVLPVELGGKVGLFDVLNGRELVPPVYTRIRSRFFRLFAVVELDGKQGAYDMREGVEILPPEYKNVRVYRENGDGEWICRFSKAGEQGERTARVKDLLAEKKAEGAAKAAAAKGAVEGAAEAPAWHAEYREVKEIGGGFYRATAKEAGGLGREYVVVDKDGKVVVGPIFESNFRWNEERQLLESGDPADPYMVDYYNVETGESFRAIDRTKEGVGMSYAHNRFTDKWFVMDFDSKQNGPEKYDEVDQDPSSNRHSRPMKLAHVRVGDKWGVFSGTLRREIIAPKYKTLRFDEKKNQYECTFEDGTVEYVNVQGRKVNKDGLLVVARLDGAGWVEKPGVGRLDSSASVLDELSPEVANKYRGIEHLGGDYYAGLAGDLSYDCPVVFNKAGDILFRTIYINPDDIEYRYDAAKDRVEMIDMSIKGVFNKWFISSKEVVPEYTFVSSAYGAGTATNIYRETDSGKYVLGPGGNPFGKKKYDRFLLPENPHGGHGGRIPFEINGKAGLLYLPTGKELIEAKYDGLWPAEREHYLFYVSLGDKMGVIDLENHMVVPIKYQGIKTLYDTNGGVRLEVLLNGKVGVLDEHGREVVPVEYKAVRKYGGESYRYIEAEDFDGVTHYFNLEGGKLDKKPFVRDWRRVGEDGKIALYDGYGSVMIEPKYTAMNRDPGYPTNLRRVNLAKDKVGIVDEVKGKEVVPPVYEAVKPFDDSAAVKLNGKWGVYNFEAGREVFATEYDEIDSSGYGVNLRVGKRWGVGNPNNGKIIVPVEYREVSPVRRKGSSYEILAYKARNGLLWHYYDMDGNRVKNLRTMKPIEVKAKNAPVKAEVGALSRRGKIAAGILATTLGVAAAVAAISGGSKGDEGSGKPKVTNPRKAEEGVPKGPKEKTTMPQYSPESVKLFSEIKLTTIQEALDKGYLVLNSQGKKVPAKGLDWKDDSKLDPQNSDTWVLVKVYGGSAAFEGQTSVPDVYADDVAYDMSQVRPYTTIGIKDIAKAKSNGYIVNGRPAKGLDFIYSNPSKDNLGSLTLVRLP